MALPGNGIFVVKGELSILMTAMRRGSRWSSHSHQDDDLDSLTRLFQELKDTLNKVDDLKLVEPGKYLRPFLEVIRSEETTGPVTSLALSSVNKFLSYGLLDPTDCSISVTVHNIADAVTHARFVGTDQSSDAVVLMKILHVLRTLTLAPEGAYITNESLCEIMLSCFRICFEMRVNELLRKTADQCLKEMVQLVFMRLPQFAEDSRDGNMKHLKMRPGTIEQNRGKKKIRASFRKKSSENKQLSDKDSEDTRSPPTAKPVHTLRANHLSTTPITPGGNIVDMQGSISQSTPPNCSAENVDVSSPTFSDTQSVSAEQQSEPTSLDSNITIKVSEASPDDNKEISQNEEPESVPSEEDSIKNTQTNDASSTNTESLTFYEQNGNQQEYVNPQGVRFTPQSEEEVSFLPYDLASVRELFRFLISLCNPLDKQNTDVMTHSGLSLLAVAFEVSADSIGKYPTLLALVKDDLCRNLFSLLNTERLSIFASVLQVSFLMFESLRTHLKFQLELYLTKLIEIIVSDSLKVTYEHKEIALDNILQLWRIPGFVTELYLNYDCDLYCTNLYEDLTKLLAKNAFPATAGVYPTHLMSLDALVTIIEGIKNHCLEKIEGKVEKLKEVGDEGEKGEIVENINKFIGKSPRIKISESVPKREDLLNVKNIKKWLPTGTDHFNHKPKKGVQFLQEHGVLKSEFDPQEIVTFLRENPNLDKKMIGEYISNRNNLPVLEAFVKRFDFTNLRIDQALRLYLETFRLPGEAPLISLLLEHFAEHWHKCNGEPFANADAAFTLAYAVIMLNVDQHNHNVKKQSNPMTPEEFKKNLKKVNGGDDFDQNMLDEIYAAIKNEEIVMPAEQTGLVRENYLWKVLLRRGASKDGQYYHVLSDAYDYDLFTLIWGPTIAALSFVFDRSEDPNVYKRTIQGFESCAFISSHFGITANLDMLVLTLCKFTLFNSQQKSYGSVQFGSNVKAQLALKTVFLLSHKFGDNIREGWKNIFDLVLTLYTQNMLPKSYLESEDFIDPSGKISLTYKEVETIQKQDTGLFSSLYSYMVSSENLSKVPTQEEQEFIDLARKCIQESNLDQLITDSKFLHEEALLEMVKTLVELSRGPDVEKSLGYGYNDNVTIFFLEILVKVVTQNRDRVMIIWPTVRDHLYTVVMNASHCDYQFLLERAVIGLLRLAIRLMRNEEMSPVVIQSLRMLLLLKGATLFRISCQISYGLFELLKTSAQNIHTNTDWGIIFTLFECVGAGAQPPKPIVEDSQIDKGAKSDGESGIQSEEDSPKTDRGYTSDSELAKSPKHAAGRSHSPIIVPAVGTNSINNTGGWILVGNEGEIQPVMGRTVPPSQYSLALERNLGPHDPRSLIKCCESLAFLVRDVAHITPYNFDDCVHCIRTFVEASLHGKNGAGSKPKRSPGREYRRKKASNSRKQEAYNRRSPISSPDEEESDEEDFPSGYPQVSIQLLDLMHTLHTRTAQIFRWWAEEGGEIAKETSLWTNGWCPLLQGIARLCCDVRRQVRMSAITYLQRALLVHDLQTLSGPEWEECFQRVLFPLLSYLLQPIGNKDPVAMEETRMRAATLLSKVFLHHLTPLLSLPTFSSLWLLILDFMDRYMHADKSDLLFEAIPESLKNMLLVMDSAKVFGEEDERGALWNLTWERIGKYLPHLKEELFQEQKAAAREPQVQEPKPPIIQSQPISDPKVNLTQHSVENATRSSIILQPPSSQQKVSSPLFAHLGQMVSTPIGPSIIQENTSNPPTSHTFPILYNNPFITTTSPLEVQPVSLYSEYIDNPYNVQSSNANESESKLAADTNALWAQYLYQKQVLQCQNNYDANKNPQENVQQHIDSSSTEVFRSSNYFNTDSNVIPPGSEILFGNSQNVNIPVFPNPNNVNNTGN